MKGSWPVRGVRKNDAAIAIKVKRVGEITAGSAHLVPMRNADAAALPLPCLAAGRRCPDLDDLLDGSELYVPDQ